MHENLKDVDTYVLTDMLARHMKNYSKLMTEGTKEDFELCKLTISQLQQEIHARQQNKDGINISDTDITFTAGTN